MKTVFLLTREEMNDLYYFFRKKDLKNNVILTSDIVNNTNSINNELENNVNELSSELTDFFTKTKENNGNKKKINLYRTTDRTFPIQTEHISKFSNIIRNNFITFFKKKNLHFKFDNKESIILLSSLLFKIKFLDVILKNIITNDWLLFFKNPYQISENGYLIRHIMTLDFDRQDIHSKDIDIFKITEDSSINTILKKIKEYFKTSPEHYSFSKLDRIYNNILQTKSLYANTTCKIIEEEIEKGLKVKFFDPADDFSKKIFIQNFPDFKNRKELDNILEGFRNKTKLSKTMFNLVLLETFVTSEKLQNNQDFKDIVENIFIYCNSHLFPNNYDKYYYFKNNKDNQVQKDFFPFIEKLNTLINKNDYLRELFLKNSCVNKFINEDEEIALKTSSYFVDSVCQNIFDFYYVLNNCSNKEIITFLNNFNLFKITKSYSNQFYSKEVMLMIQNDTFNSLIRCSDILTKNDKERFAKIIPGFKE